MKTIIITDVRIFKIKNKYYTKAAFFKILERYSKSFNFLSIATRIIEKEKIEKDYIEISSLCQEFINVGSIISTFIPFKKNNINEKIKDSDFVILRLPSVVTISLYRFVKKNKKVYMTEIMGCAWDAFWNHSLTGKIIALPMFFKMKNIVKKSYYSLYVTSEFLQKRYPCGCNFISASNVKINEFPDNIIENRIKKISNTKVNAIKLMTSAAVDVKYKGQEYVIKAIPLLKQNGIDVKYYLAGGGDSSRLKKIAKKNNAQSNVIFLGSLKHEEIFEYLDQIDMYIQPSLQEGLPRAVIEALSRGCPVIGAKTAGIPELIQNEFVVKRKSKKDIANKINYFINLNKEQKKQIVIQNFNKSKNYSEKKLDNFRNKYYEQIKKDFNNNWRC